MNRTASLLAGAWVLVLGFAGAALRAPPSASAAPDEPTTLRAMYRVPDTARVSRSRTALVLVDFQEDVFGPKLHVAGADAAAAHARELLDWARRSGVRVVHVRNIVPRKDSYLFAEGSPGAAIVPRLAPAPGEAVVTKPMGGGFSRSDLDRVLRDGHTETIVVAGIMTHLAVDTTAREGAVLGYRVLVAADACATRALPSATGDGAIDAATVHRVALASIADRFAEVRATAAITALPVDP